MFSFFSSKSKKTKTVPRKYQNLRSKKSNDSFWSRKSQPKKIERQSFHKKKIINPFELLFDFHLNHSKRLFFVFITLLIIGVIAIFSSTIVFAYRYTDDKYYYLFSQIKLIGIGFVFMSFFYFIRIEVIAKLWYIPFIICVGLLTYLVYLSFTTPADIAIDGATRWLRVGGFQFQPSDFAKLAFVIFIAAFLGRLQHHYRDTKDFLKRNFFPFCLSFFLILMLILLGRNLGTAMVVGFIGLACYGATAVTKYQKIGFVVICLGIVIGGVLFGIVESYRAERISVWVNYIKTNDTVVTKDGKSTAEASSYQFDQGLTACGSGGLFGVGLGDSIGKFYLPKTSAGDDSIVCVMGEELGFFMLIGILFLYIYLVFACFSLAREMWENPVYYLLLIGIGSWIGFQMFVHVGANIGVIPLTGQTLPFVSLGGSSIISLMGAIGLVLNVSKQREKFLPKERAQR